MQKIVDGVKKAKQMVEYIDNLLSVLIEVLEKLGVAQISSVDEELQKKIDKF